MSKLENLPEFYTQREIDKARSRNRLMGRLEGAGAVIAFGVVMSFIPWIPWLAVAALVGWVVWKLVSKSKDSEE